MGKRGTWESWDLIGCYNSGWKIFWERPHRIDIPVVPCKPGSTLPIHLISAIQELASVLRPKGGPPQNVLYAHRPDEVHEPRRKRKENFSGTGWSLNVAMKASVTALGTETYAEIRRVKEAQQSKHRPFGEKGVPRKVRS